MVIIAQIWMDHTLVEAKKIAEERNVNIPRQLKVYMDDTTGILRQNDTNTAHIDFANCLSAVDPRLKFTYEIEEDKKLPFLDVLVTHEENGSLSFSVYRKPSNTGLTIDPKSNQDPNTWIGVFKSALCRAHRICSSPSLRNKEIEFLINNFHDNGWDRKILKTRSDRRPIAATGGGRSPYPGIMFKPKFFTFS